MPPQDNKQTKTAADALKPTSTPAEKPLAVSPQTDTAVDKGREKLPRRFTDWDSVRDKALSVFQIPTSFKPAATSTYAKSSLYAIEKSFKFSGLPTDQDFRSLHVEPLLDQAANLIDRCLVDRAQRDLYLVEWFKLKMELEQFLRLDDVLAREIAAGLYTLPYERAVRESAAENQIAFYYKNAMEQINRISARQSSDDSFNKQYGARQLAAWLNAFPLKADGLKGDDATYGWNTVKKTKPDHLYDAAVQGGLEELYSFYFSIYSQSDALQGTSEASRFRRESFDRLADWSNKDIDFRKERTQIARDIVEQKVYQTTLQDGVLNYLEKAQPIEARFQLDFREALARLVAVRQGMKELYGYSADFPVEGSTAYFDAVVLWIREAINWLVRFSRLEQNYVLPISLKNLKKKRLAERKDGDNWTFTISEDLFPNQRHVRLRGLGAAVVRDDGAKGLWQMEITLPKDSSTRHLSGTAVKIDQARVPQCYLGRVVDRSSYRDAEITGINALHNASPFGSWKLAMSHQSTLGTKSSSLDDVQIDLHLAVRTIPPTARTEFILDSE
jgi:hypothetical protein